jgi:hypothetical protein
VGQREREKAAWATGQIKRREGFSFSKTFFYFVFKTKFNSNSNIVLNILFKMRTFGRFSKINFATFKTLLFFNSLLSFFPFTSKLFSNLFPKAIQTILNLDSNHSTN